MISIVIIDGTAIVQILKPAAVKNFLLKPSFHIIIVLQLQNAIHIDLVWDRYMESTLKSTATAKCDKEMCGCVASGTPIPRNWQDFLCVNVQQ